jgi:AcrR family transcriptional regulator
MGILRLRRRRGQRDSMVDPGALRSPREGSTGSSLAGRCRAAADLRISFFDSIVEKDGGGAMPKQVDASEQRREIREAARAVFARRGVNGTGLAHVAEALGLGRSSLYHYYADKDALLSDLVLETLREERAMFRACLDGPGSAQERVLRLMDANVALFDAWGALGRAIVELRVGDAKRFRRFFREVRAELAEVLRAGQRAGEVDPALDPVLCAATLIGAIDGLLLQHLVDPRALDVEALREELRRVARRTLAP